METLKTHDWRWTIIVGLGSALVTLIAAQQMHVSNEVSRPELQADVAAAVSPIIARVENETEQMRYYHEQDSLALWDFVHGKIRVTWKYNER